MAAAAAAGLALLLLRPAAVVAGVGSSGYETFFSSTAPTGYPASPATTTRGANLEYDFTVTNNDLPLMSDQLTATIYVQRVTSINNTDVSSGEPGFPEQTVLAAVTSGDPVAVVGTISDTLPGQSSQPYAEVIPGRELSSCGYYVVWVGSSPDRTSAGSVLNQGATRINQCPTPAPTSNPPPPRPPPRTPPPTSNPTPGHGHPGGGQPPPSAPAAPFAPFAPAVTGSTPGPTAPAGASALAPTPTEGPTPDGSPTPAPPPFLSNLITGSSNSGIRAVTAILGAAIVLAAVAGAVLVAIRERRRRPAPRAGQGQGTVSPPS